MTLLYLSPARQEWKKAWISPGGYGPLMGVEPLGDAPRYSARPRNFTISAADGIVLLRSML